MNKLDISQTKAVSGGLYIEIGLETVVYYEPVYFYDILPVVVYDNPSYYYIPGGYYVDYYYDPNSPIGFFC